MLVDTSKLKIFHFSNGEEIIADLIESNDEVVRIHKPVRVIHVPNVDGTATVAVLKFTLLSDDEWINIGKDKIICVMSPNKEAIDYYLLSLRKQYEDWATDKAQKEQAKKDFEELKSIAEDEPEKEDDPDGNIAEEVDVDEKDLDIEVDEKPRHRKRNKKYLN